MVHDEGAHRSEIKVEAGYGSVEVEYHGSYRHELCSFVF
jgi:hypothetical protein